MSAQPWLVMVTGEPGSGKTTLGLALSAALRVPYFSRDLVRGGMLATDGLWTNSRSRDQPRVAAVEAHVRIIEQAAALGVSCVIEFIVTPDRVDAMRRIEAATNVLVIVLTAADASRRVEERDRSDALLNRPDVLASLGHTSIEEYLASPELKRIREEIQTDSDRPTLRVTTDSDYEPSFDTIVDWVINQTR